MVIVSFVAAHALRKSTAATAPPSNSPAPIVNLWVERRMRQIETEESRELWICLCGCRSFYWYRNAGLICCRCEKPTRPPA